MKFLYTLLLFISMINMNLWSQESGPGCEYRGRRPYRVYQKPVISPDDKPAYEYSQNSVLPLRGTCLSWGVYGDYGSCYVYDGSYHAGYAGNMMGVECPIDDYIFLLMISLSPLGFFLIRKKTKHKIDKPFLINPVKPNTTQRTYDLLAFTPKITENLSFT